MGIRAMGRYIGCKYWEYTLGGKYLTDTTVQVHQADTVQSTLGYKYWGDKYINLN